MGGTSSLGFDRSSKWAVARECTLRTEGRRGHRLVGNGERDNCDAIPNSHWLFQANVRKAGADDGGELVGKGIVGSKQSALDP